MSSNRKKIKIPIEDRLRKEFNFFVNLEKSQSLGVSSFKLFSTKVQGHQPLRARFADVMYDYLKARRVSILTIIRNILSGKKLDNFFQYKLPFILEVIISIQYYHNQILDGKKGVELDCTNNDKLIFSNLLKEQLYRYLRTIRIGRKRREKLIATVRSIFENVDIGQHMDKHCNSYSAFQTLPDELPEEAYRFKLHSDHFINESIIEDIAKIIQGNAAIHKENLPYLYVYLKRIYLLNASLFKLSTKLICELLNINEADTKNAVKYAVHFGIIQQLVNDNTDFIPAKMKSPSFKYPTSTKAKSENDCFSDLKNKCITLPIIIHLQRCGNGKIAKYLEDEIYEIDEKVFFEEIVEEWSIFYSISTVKAINDCLQKQIEEESQDFRQNFASLCSSAKNNKFYKRYRTYSNSNGNLYKKYKKYKKMQKKVPVC